MAVTETEERRQEQDWYEVSLGAQANKNEGLVAAPTLKRNSTVALTRVIYRL